MTIGSWGKKIAFFDLVVTCEQGEITMKGFSLVETLTENQKLNRFVGYPSKPSTKEEGKYDDFVWMDKDLKQKLEHLATEHYTGMLNQEHSVDQPVMAGEDVPF
jgi:hypothetical protein